MRGINDRQKLYKLIYQFVEFLRVESEKHEDVNTK